MEIYQRIQLFQPADVIAVLYLVLAYVGVGLLIERDRNKHLSVSVLMQAYRRDWMVQFITRQPRIFDASILASLRQGTTFFASACMIAIGGGLALIGNTERLLGVAADLSLETAPAVVWEIKIIVVLIFLGNAFLKFVWSHRLFGYCAVVMASVPNDIDDPKTLIRAGQAAEINITAARSYNRGLRSVYFSLAALALLLGAFPQMLATTVTLLFLWRREFASHSRKVLLQTLDAPNAGILKL